MEVSLRCGEEGTSAGRFILETHLPFASQPFLVQAEQDKIEYENARRMYEDRHSGNIIYRSSGELGHGSSTSVLAYPPYATDVATDDEGEASDGLSDPPEES